MTIKVKYSCYQCGIYKREVDVPIRQEHEDVVHWVEQTVGMSIKKDHSTQSPNCTATSIQDLMIPITGAKMLGGPSIQ